MTSYPQQPVPGRDPGPPEPRYPDPAGTAAAGVGPRVGEPLSEEDASYRRYQQEDRSIGEIASDVLDNASTLIRQELDLAKAEVKQSATQAGKGAGMLAGAGVAGHLMLISLTLTVWWALAVAIGDSEEPALGWSGLIVTIIWAVVAAVLALVGKNELSNVQGIPRTQDTVKKIPNAATGNEEKNR